MKYSDYLLPYLALVSGWTFAQIIIIIVQPEYRTPNNALVHWLPGIAGISVIYLVPTLALYIRRKLRR